MQYDKTFNSHLCELNILIIVTPHLNLKKNDSIYGIFFQIYMGSANDFNV